MLFCFRLLRDLGCAGVMHQKGQGVLICALELGFLFFFSCYQTCSLFTGLLEEDFENALSVGFWEIRGLAFTYARKTAGHLSCVHQHVYVA